MNEKEQLLPCPFCGGDNVEIIEHDDVPADLYTCTVCHYCEDGSTTCFSGDTKQEAINKWNTRAISADEKEQLRRLKAFVGDITSNIGIVDSFNSIMDASIRHGLFDRKVHHEPCGEVCACKYHADKHEYQLDWGKGVECGLKKADWLKDENEQYKLIMQEAEKALNTPPCMECGAFTREEAEKLCKCGGDRDHCHGCDLWPDD